LLPSAPEPAGATAESAKAAAAAEAATSKAITPKSSTAKTVTPKASAAGTVKAAALKVLETLAGKVASGSVLSLAVYIAETTLTTRSVEAATGAIRGAFTGAIVAAPFG
jgi:hypothetical protein